MSSEVVDIKDISVQTEEAITTKMVKYFAEVGDPYRFHVGKIRVSVVFGKEGGISLESGLEKILRRKM